LLAQLTSQTFDAACTLLLAKVFLFGTPGGPAAGQIISAALTAAVPLLVGGPIAAIVVDRFPRRRILLAGQAIRGAVAFTYLVLEMRCVWVGCSTPRGLRACVTLCGSTSWWVRIP
jgi:MFS family permease